MANSPAESPLKASNISEFVQKMAQAYKRKPSTSLARQFEQMQRISDESNLTDVDASSSGGGGSKTPSRNRSTELDAEGYGGSIVNANRGTHPPPAFVSPSPLPDPSLLAVKVRVLETLVSNMFSTVSSLRSTFLQFQAAQSSSDVGKLEAAEKSMAAHIRRLNELKHSYLERDAIVSGQSAEHGSPETDPSPISSFEEYRQQQQPQSRQQQQQQIRPPKDVLLKSYEGIIHNFHIEVRKKNAEVESLKDMLAESTLQKEKVEKKMKRLEQRLAKEAASINGLPSTSDANVPLPQLLESSVQEAAELSRSFTKLLISLMKAAQWDLDAACDSIEVGVNYARRSHRKYAFESYVCQQMWNGFENDDFYIFGSLSSIIDPEKHRRECYDEYLDMRGLDPLELISVNPDCLFGKFCHKKFLQLVHPKMETSFFGNFEHRNQITEGRHPNSQFYQSFLRLAKTVWLVHRLAFAFSPTASIFQVRRGARFSPSCMESVVLGMELDENHLPAKVGFSVMPGFRVNTVVIKSQVYLESTEASMDLAV
ncbi:hypothetical protein L7F22_056354 [Adiantum nelumboides]|nr:hypothetical protein [Adiantum nelumboides]